MSNNQSLDRRGAASSCRKSRNLLWLVACSGLACGLALSAVTWKPAHAGSPGSAGSGSVNPAFGTYGDSIDIDVPTFHGIEPRLKLTYASGNPNGFVGVGWVLSGESFIERASSGGGTPDYDDSTDTYLLDGAKLIPGTAFGGTHQTERESYKRIVKSSNGWDIWDKDGTHSQYTVLYQYTIGGAQRYFRWALSTVTDTNGNTVTYNYAQDANPPTGYVGNWYLDNVTYDTNGANGYTIKLWRETRPDTLTFANGSSNLGVTTQRLKTIQVKVGSSNRRVYALTYNAPANPNRSLLASVQEFGSDATVDGSGIVTAGPTPPLPAQVLTYTPAGVGFGGASDNLIGPWLGSSWEDMFGDINGDGKPDLIRIWKSGTGIFAHIELGNGSAFTYNGNDWAQTLLNENGNPCTWDDNDQFFLGDVDGDGRTDLIRIYLNNDTTMHAMVWRSNGVGFPGNAHDSSVDTGGTATAMTYVADVDGDGRADLVRVWPNGTTAYADVHLSNGTDFPTKTSSAAIGAWDTTTHDMFVDLNSDGKADLVRIYNSNGHVNAQVDLSNGTGFPRLSNEFNQQIGNNWYANSEFFSADLNGDGNMDIVRVSPNSGTTAYCDIELSTGSGLAQGWSGDIGAWDTSYKTYFVDVNGDGRADLVRIWQKTSAPAGQQAYAEIHLFDGTGYSGPPAWNNSVGGWTGNRTYAMDIDGDGKTDLVRIWEDGSGNAQASILVSAGGVANPSPDLLVTHANGLGGTTTITYEAESSSNAPTTGAYVNRGGGNTLVSQITVDDGRNLGGTGTTLYSYSDPLFDFATRTFLGFGMEDATVDALGTYIVTHNRQTVESVGDPDAIYTKAISTGGLDNGPIYSYTTFIYAEGGNPDATTNPTPWTSLVSSTSDFENNTWDSSGASARQSRNTFTYDGYGNQTLITHEGDVGGVTTGDFCKSIAYAMNLGSPNYIVDAERSERKYMGLTVGGTQVAQAIYYYDGDTSGTAAPTAGNLTRTDNYSDATHFVTGTATYDPANGNQLTATDPRGSITTTVYDTTYHQYPTTVTNALNQTTTYAYDPNFQLGLVHTVQDPNGIIVTTNGYDSLGRLTSVQDANHNTTATTYNAVGDPNNQYVMTTVPDGSAAGLWTKSYFDGLGRTYQMVRKGTAGGDYIKQTKYLDAGSLPAQTSLWYAGVGGATKWETFNYDGAGRLVLQIHPDNSTVQIGYTLDATTHKPCSIVTDENGKQRTIYNDSAENLIQVKEKNGASTYTTTRAYDVDGRLLTVTDNANNTNTYTYDWLGNNLTIDDMDSGHVVSTYDNGGLLLTQTDAKSQQRTITYDALGRIKTKLVGGQTTTWNYDQTGHGPRYKGQLTSVVYPTGSESYTYGSTTPAENRDMVTSTTKVIGTTSKTMSATYDSAGRLATQTYPDTEVVTYGYGFDGNMTTTSSSLGTNYVTGMTYGATGNLLTVAYGNGTVATYTYDDAAHNGRMWLLTADITYGSTNLYHASYTNDVGARVTGMTQNSGALPSDTTTYGYDDLNRLTSVSGSQSQTYTYDTNGLGNMLTNSGMGSGNYSYTASAHKHAVKTVGSIAAYTYDANGDMTQSVVSGITKNLVWDADRRLTSVTQGSAVTSFTYGLGEERVSKTSSTGTTLYFSSLLETTPTGDIQYYYAGPILVAKKAAGTKTWYHSDRLGSTRLMSNATGGVVADADDYFPFGTVSNSSGSMANDRGFTGQIADPETGLLYCNARYYDTTLGRYISSDTVPANETDPQDLNAYSYCHNNPINNIDPTGHMLGDTGGGGGRYSWVTYTKVTVHRWVVHTVPYIHVWSTLEPYSAPVTVTRSARVRTRIGSWVTLNYTYTTYQTYYRSVTHSVLAFRTTRREISYPVEIAHIHTRIIYHPPLVRPMRGDVLRGPIGQPSRPPPQYTRGWGAQQVAPDYAEGRPGSNSLPPSGGQSPFSTNWGVTTNAAHGFYTFATLQGPGGQLTSGAWHGIRAGASDSFLTANGQFGYNAAKHQWDATISAYLAQGTVSLSNQWITCSVTATAGVDINLVTERGLSRSVPISGGCYPGPRVQNYIANNLDPGTAWSRLMYYMSHDLTPSGG